MRLVALGVALGLAGGMLFALLLRKILFGLGGAFDPLAIGVVTLLFASVAFLACWLPARRATQADPMAVLRTE
jgi:ABC-type antimicrobial peptide transport system permease subunit